MKADELKDSVTAALTRVRHPALGKDVLASGQVQNLEVDASGEVRFSFVMRADDPPELLQEVRSATEAVAGVTGVKVNVQLPQTAPRGGQGGLAPGSVSAPTPQPEILADVKHVMAVSSGKGGVGKSMVAANLAAAFARLGHTVGLLDADIYGPNIPLMFGESGHPQVTGERGREMIAPLEAHGVRLMSLGFLLDKEQPAIMRGPLISGILKQFLQQVDWGALDIFVVDMPPGTGDAQLSLVQTIDLDGVVMITTPQEMATTDVRRGVKMFERVNTRVLGVVENMSGFSCPHCGEVVDVFGSGGGERLASEMKLPFLGRIPLDPEVRRAGDEGSPTVVSAPESAAGRARLEVARSLERTLAAGKAP